MFWGLRAVGGIGVSTKGWTQKKIRFIINIECNLIKTGLKDLDFDLGRITCLLLVWNRSLYKIPRYDKMSDTWYLHEICQADQY